MSETAVRPRAGRAPGEPARPPRVSPVGATVSAAVVAAAVGLVLVSVLVLLAWATDARSAAGAGAAVRAAALAWLVAHRVPVEVSGGAFALAPLGFTLVAALACARGARDVVRRCRPPSPGQAAAFGVAFGLPYGVLAAIVAALAGGSSARVSVVAAAVNAGLVGALGGVAGALRGFGGRPVVPARVAMLARASCAALCALAATGAAVMAVSIGWHASRVASLVDALDAGLAGSVVLLLLCLAYAPNAVVWAATYALGTGFAIGAGSLIAPTGVRIGPLPAFPLLAALPGAGAAPLPSLLALAGALAAGMLAGWFVARALPGATPGRAAAWALAAGPCVAVVVALAAWLSGGPAGPGRLAVTGPSPLLAALAAAEWVSLAGAATAALLAWRARRADQP